MRRSSDWDEEMIEQQLRQLPKIMDKQSKEELYHKIQLNLNRTSDRKKINVAWILPTVASAAILFLAYLIAPTFIGDEQMAIDERGYKEEVQEEMTLEMANYTDINDEVSLYVGAAEADEVVYGEQLLTLAFTALYDTGELAVPITLNVEGESLLERIQQAKENFVLHDEFGLGHFPSLDMASVSEVDQNTLQIDFLNDHNLESLSSAQTVMYSVALEETFFALGYNKLTFTTGEKPGVEFGQIGDWYEVDLNKPSLGYFVYTSKAGFQFLVRGRAIQSLVGEFYDAHLSFEEELLLMKQAELPTGIRSPIPEHVNIVSTFGEKDQVTIVLNDYEASSEQEALIMIEAILFAARDFGYTGVKFEGVKTQHVGPYNLETVVTVPKFINYLNQ
ncbi:MAG: hypothetical protein LRY71_07895 [Bacillaceae bacterium]|nr:hypothetical protein [Bacillaceae bacterium]